jgi:hypothetical protein
LPFGLGQSLQPLDLGCKYCCHQINININDKILMITKQWQQCTKSIKQYINNKCPSLHPL